MEPISVYTREQAIEDGVLIRFEDYLRRELDKDECGCAAIREIRENKDAKFPLGELVITENAAAVLDVADACRCLMLHQVGDWGVVCEEDRAANQEALREGMRLFSVYEVESKGQKIRFYIITEWNREATTILLPEDY